MKFRRKADADGRGDRGRAPHEDDADGPSQPAPGPFDVVPGRGRRRRAGRPRLAAGRPRSRAASCGCRSTRPAGACRRSCWPGPTAPSSSRPSPHPATATCGRPCARRSPPTSPGAAAQATEREGRCGTELVCQMPGAAPGRHDRDPAVARSSASTASAGCCVPRCWAARPLEPDAAADWEDALAQVVVRRGDQRDAGRRAAAGRRCPTTPAGSLTRPDAAWPEKSRLRQRSASGPTAEDQHAARPARDATQAAGTVSIADAPDREQVIVSGVAAHRDAAPARRRARARGRARRRLRRHHRGLARAPPDHRRRPRSVGDGRRPHRPARTAYRIMFNPRYELRP